MPGRCYLLAAGGTGGHLFPGIAVAEVLMELEPDARVLFAGSDREIEQQILKSTPYQHCVLPAMSMAGALRRPIRFIRRSLSTRRAARQLIDEYKPDVVVGCGGFASAAPVYVAWQLGIPRLLLEQNVIPGRATRWLCRLGAPVCVSFEETIEHLPRSTTAVLTGNPVRRAIADILPDQQRRTLLVLGGSQGARAINQLLIDFLGHQVSELDGWQVVHQTGTTDADRVRQAYSGAGIDADVQPFFDDTPALYRRASAVVARAGATTLAELACAGLPALLVPFPYAQDDHQRENSRWYQRHGAVSVFDEQPRSSNDVVDFGAALRTLLQDESRRSCYAAAMSRLARPDAAMRVVEVISGLTAGV